jgi:shikimate kinase
MILKLKRTPGIYLVGFMASGKTTIGRLLADELGWSFADLDEDIEAAHGSPVSEIFEKHGEGKFRTAEKEAVRRRITEIERGKPMVLALGGGAFADEANQTLLHNNGVTIWLDCSFPRVCARVEGTTNRPLARDPEKFQQLYHERKHSYSKAEYRIEVETDNPAEVVQAILKLGIL